MKNLFLKSDSKNCRFIYLQMSTNAEIDSQNGEEKHLLTGFLSKIINRNKKNEEPDNNSNIVSRNR